jgi:circadian clock protein KaiC
MSIDKLRTGVPGLDVITHGGIPKGRTTLICGRSGTAKSILSLQLACNLARAGQKSILVAVEETPEDIVTTARSLSFDLEGLVEKRCLRIADMTRPMDGPTLVSGRYDVQGFIDRIRGLVDDLGATVLVLDSATAFFSPKPDENALRSLFFQLVSAFRKLGLTAIVTAESLADYGALTALGVEDFVCDLVLVLRNLVDGERRRRSMEVHKYRRSGHYKGEYPCTITSKGMTIFPLDAQDRTELESSSRFSSGLPGLDEMNNGGWLRDSIVLLRGPSGSGKTTLAGMYARAGAARGERVVYYGFEETKPILMRNFANIGLPMEELERSGRLRVACRYPEATSPEDLLVDLRTGLDEFKPSLVVLDSISSIEHSTSPRGFRQFIVGVASQLREHGRSALVTQTVGRTDFANAEAPFLSTIPDAICLLDYSFGERELRRTIQVLKMRGSPHVTERRKLTIRHGGLSVEPLAPVREGGASGAGLRPDQF